MGRLFSSLRFKFALGLGISSAVILGCVMFLIEQDIRTSLIRENISKGIGIASIVALNTEDPLLTGDDTNLFSVVRNALLSPGIRYAAIAGRDGIVRAADDMTLVGKPFATSSPATEVEGTNSYTVRRFFKGNESILDIEVPLVTKGERSLKLGEIHLGLSEDIITKAINNMRQTLLIVTLSVMLLGGFIAYWLAGVAVKPIHALVVGVKSVGEGNLNQHIELKRNDELGILTTAFNDMTSSLREKEYIKNTFERYVSKELAQQILEHKNELRLGGEEKNVTILFCDLRGFTSLAEKLTPPEVVEFLNMYFTEVINAVGRYDGMVDKFMGDAVMVLFGAPVSVGDEALKAVQCAREIEQLVEKINRDLRAKEKPGIAVGIGINSGPVIAGNIGSQNRMEYTVIGDNVNLASRLEGLNKIYGTTILLSEATGEGLNAANLPLRELDIVQVVGKKRAVRIFELSQAAATLRDDFATALDLYRQARFAEARDIFSRLAASFDDPPSRVMAERCSNYMTHPPAEWNGIYIAGHK